jgi:hypothetical protein
MDIERRLPSPKWDFGRFFNSLLGMRRNINHACDAVFCEDPDSFQIFGDRIADVVQCFRFGIPLRLATGKPGNVHARATGKTVSFGKVLATG